MNNLQPNEKHLADKLQHVPVPDVDQSWEKMQELLDRDRPRAVGGWGSNSKWWWTGIAAASIMLAIWLTQELNNAKNAQAPGNNATAAAETGTPQNNSSAATGTNKESASPSNPTAAAGSGTTVNSNGNNDTGSDPSNDVSNNADNDANNNNAGSIANSDVSNRAHDASREANNDPGNSSGSSDNNDHGLNKPNTTNDRNTNDRNAATNTTANNITNTPAVKTTAKNTNSRDNRPVTPSLTKDKSRNPLHQQNAGKPGNKIIEQVSTEKYVNNKQDKPVQAANTPFQSAERVTSTEDEMGLRLANVTASIDGPELDGSPADVFSNVDHISPDNDLLAKADKAEVRRLRQKFMEKDNRRMNGRRMRGNYGGNEHEITFAAGLTLPQSFAVAGQQASSYNITGKTGRLTDYIPAPFFQYHINNKIFLQTEFHFQSPQYTQKLLLNQRISGDSSGQIYREVNSSYLEKLYYFNIPLNVYYTPAPNFYIGTGLQYSSFLGGVLMQERRVTQQGITDVQNSAYRFRDDSLATRISPSEFRYQFDANYYFQRFTLGLRYNQAMKDFIKSNEGRVRNQSLLLYLRFNIWEERKKGSSY